MWPHIRRSKANRYLHFGPFLTTLDKINKKRRQGGRVTRTTEWDQSYQKYIKLEGMGSPTPRRKTPAGTAQSHSMGPPAPGVDGSGRDHPGPMWWWRRSGCRAEMQFWRTNERTKDNWFSKGLKVMIREKTSIWVSIFLNLGLYWVSILPKYGSLLGLFFWPAGLFS